jgi:hypothetical protein
MKFIEHPECNDVLGAPKNWAEENPHLPCYALPILREYIQDGFKSHPCVVSFWKPTDDELEILANGGSVRLSVLGQSMAPVIVGVEK